MDSPDDEFAEDNSSLLSITKVSGPNLYQNLKSEYFDIVDNPKRLPFFFHPIISSTREFSITGERTFFTPSIYLKDHINVPRRIYFNLETINLGIGATGGLLIGLTTQEYFKGRGTLAKIASQAWLKNVESKPASDLQKFAYTSTIISRVVKRAFFGAVGYDLLKRNAEHERGKEDWINPAFAGFVSGAAFGLRGGFQTGVMGAFGFSLCMTVHHFFPDLRSWGF